MKLLALDTSGPLGSVALGVDQAPPREIVLENRLRHEGGLAPAVRQLLETEGLSLQDVDRVVVGLGPGSYTGIRIGVTFAKMLAHAAGLELQGFPGFDVLAWDAAAGNEGPVALMARAHPGRVYAAIHEVVDGALRTVSPVALRAPEEVLAALPSGARVFADEATRENLTHPCLELPERVRAAGLVTLARAAIAEGRPLDDPRTLLPLYLQAAAPER